MNELHQKILDAARDEVAQKYGYDNWKDVEKKATSGQENGMLSESTELAMDRQWSFMLWTFWTDWIYSDGRFMNSKSGDVLSDLGLYDIWRREQK